VGSNFFIPIVCAIKTDKKIIAISFDDGPDPENSPRILQLLRHHNAEAAFFCIGNRIPGNETILTQADSEGHIIGNHTFSHHFWFDLFSFKKMASDIRSMDEAMYSVIGKRPKLFRPPYGVTNPNVKRAIVHGNYIPVGWSVRSMDTVIKDEKKLLEKMVRKIKPGAVFLFHDTSITTLSILPEFLTYVRSNGYEIMRLDKMLALQPYA
jgi:peptidoglycan/xylan/chitin deacetylase (PgdA/CDA1 family)